MGITSQPPRPRQHLIAAGKLYPGAWRQTDEFRAARGKTVPDWPEWCYLPLSAWYAIISADARLQRLTPVLAGDVGRLGAIGAWRITQGVYRFDPSLYAALVTTPVEGDLPHDVLYRLPEWCVYVETPDMAVDGSTLYGFFAHLEHDANTGRPELRLLLDSESALMPIPIHLGDWTLAESVASMADVARIQAMGMGVVELPGGTTAMVRSWVEPLISLLLYLCTKNAEIGDGTRTPCNPEPKRTKNGWRMFAPESVTAWDVGVRIGAALRRAYHSAETETELAGSHATPRAHIRRAHWHGYWTGSRITPETRKFDLRWLPPIPVNLDSADDLPVTVRPIEGWVDKSSEGASK
jgi:hypothetical protein